MLFIYQFRKNASTPHSKGSNCNINFGGVWEGGVWGGCYYSRVALPLKSSLDRGTQMVKGTFEEPESTSEREHCLIISVSYIRA